MIAADQWKLVFGRADIKGNQVDMRYGNESRVMSTTKRASKNAVFTTEATLRSGWGTASGPARRWRRAHQ